MEPFGRHRLILSVLFLLAAVLACNMPGVGDEPAVTDGPTITPTLLVDSATTVAVISPQAATEEPTTTPEPTAVPAIGADTTPVIVDPCSLLTTAEVESLLGEPAGEPTPVDGGCIYQEPVERMETVTVFAVQGEAAADALGAQLFLVSLMGGVQIDEATTQEATALAEAGDVVGLVEQLTALTVGQPGLHAEAVEGLGEAALWVWKELDGAGAPQQGFLVAAQGQTAVGINLVVTQGQQQSDTLAVARPLVEQLLSRFP